MPIRQRPTSNGNTINTAAPTNKVLNFPWDDFPICDDTTDDLTPPSTPTEHRPSMDNGPRTAPLSGHSGFPFSFPSTVAQQSTPPRRPRHQRTPSDGVFSMSFDDDQESTPQKPEELHALFGGMFPFADGKSKTPPGSVRATKDTAGYFASSMFQNSPNPEELPPPRFGAVV